MSKATEQNPIENELAAIRGELNRIASRVGLDIGSVRSRVDGLERRVADDRREPLVESIVGLKPSRHDMASALAKPLNELNLVLAGYGQLGIVPQLVTVSRVSMPGNVARGYRINIEV